VHNFCPSRTSPNAQWYSQPGAEGLLFGADLGKAGRECSGPL